MMLVISKYPVNVSNFTNLNIIIIMNDDMIKFLFEFNLEKTLGRRYPNGINWIKEIMRCFIEILYNIYYPACFLINRGIDFDLVIF